MIPEELTPDDLRAEATRRELSDRHKRIGERRTARNVVVDAILAIDGKAVYASQATAPLTTALTILAREDEADQKSAPTNGEVAMAGRNNWWDEVIKRSPHVETHPVLKDITLQRRRPRWQ